MSRKSRKSATPAASTSQQTIEELFDSSQQSVEDQVNNCVRYIVNNFSQNAYFRRADFQKNCAPKAGQQLQRVINSVTNILKDIYGLNLIVCDSGKEFVVSNALPYMNYNTDKTVSDESKRRIVLLIMLSHIFMSNGSVSENLLFSFLKSLAIDVHVRHPVFGVVKEYITSLIKQKFLRVETDSISKKNTYFWGIRAEKEVSQHEILKFVSKVYKDCKPKDWADQYLVASKQGLENERLDEGQPMDVY